MALLENLQSGQVYLVKVSASNQMGDGPFSPAVELSVHADAHASQTHGTGAQRVLCSHALPSLSWEMLIMHLNT